MLISGHSLAIDESSMTGESKIVSSLWFCLCNFYGHLPFLFANTDLCLQVHKDQKSPFLMSGCKVADGVGNMLVNL